jgi:NUMOD3 motif
MSDFYSYLWLREDGSPYYAGKGRGTRAFTSTGHNVHRPADGSRILVFPMLSESEAFESEIALIDLFGRKDFGTGCLRNITYGGEGPCGRVVSDDTKQKMRDKALGVKKSEAHKHKLSLVAQTRIGNKNHFYGRTHSEETKQRIRNALLGRTIPEDVKQKMIQARGNQNRDVSGRFC